LSTAGVPAGFFFTRTGTLCLEGSILIVSVPMPCMLREGKKKKSSKREENKYTRRVLEGWRKK